MAHDPAGAQGVGARMKTVVLLSGGVDSLVLLAREVWSHCEVTCVSVDYGQAHLRELDAARAQVARYQQTHRVVTVSPYPHAAGSVVIPNRNAVLISLGAAVAVEVGTDRVLIGANGGDRDVFPDCREAFIEAMDAATFKACGVHVYAPWVRMTKAEVVAIGRRLNVNFDSAWSCYAGGAEPCGACLACTTRKAAGA